MILNYLFQVLLLFSHFSQIKKDVEVIALQFEILQATYEFLLSILCTFPISINLSNALYT